MFKRETQLQEAVKSAIEKEFGSNVWFYHPREGKCGRKGILDCILCFYGCFIAVELKRDLNESDGTGLQKYNINLIIKAGGFGIVCDNVENVILKLKTIKRSLPHGRN